MEPTYKKHDETTMEITTPIVEKVYKSKSEILANIEQYEQGILRNQELLAAEQLELTEAEKLNLKTNDEVALPEDVTPE